MFPHVALGRAAAKCRFGLDLLVLLRHAFSTDLLVLILVGNALRHANQSHYCQSFPSLEFRQHQLRFRMTNLIEILRKLWVGS